MKKSFIQVLCAIMVCCMFASLFACQGGTITEVESEIVISNGTASIDNGGNTTNNDNSSNASATTSSNKSTSTVSNSNGSAFNPYEGIEKYKGQKVKFATWWKLTENEQKVVNDFENKYGITVDIENYQYEVYPTKVAASISSGMSPDLCAISGKDYLTFITNDLVQPISAGKFDIKNDKKYDLNTMRTLSYKGKMYGVNIANNMTYGRYCIYYNKTMFDNNGLTDPYKLWKSGEWNWDTFADCAKKLTSRKGKTTIYGYTGLDTTIEGWMLSCGADFITYENNKFSNNLKSAPVEKALTFISELRNGGYWCPDEDTGSFASGNAAMMGDTTWMIEAKCYPNTSDEWGIVPIPCPKGQKEILGYSLTSWCIATGAKNPIPASYFIRYWLDFDNCNIEKAIPKTQCREVFNYLSDTSKNRKASIARSVASYYESSQYWELLHISRSSANDIPVDLESYYSKIDSIIQKIK